MEAAVETPQKEGVNNVPDERAKEKLQHEKKSKKEERNKSDKNVDQFMKSVNSVQSLEEKFALVCKKYLESAEQTKKAQFYIKQSDKRYALLLKEKEQLQQEFNKAILFKSKLENLCRELQKQNKAIKEESLLKVREEEEKRKETHTKFQTTLSEITTMLQTNNEKNAKLRDDNISMSEKFKTIVSQYQLREQQVEKMAKQMSLESQLSEAKLQKSNLEHQAEKNRLLAEMEQTKMELAQSQAKIQDMQGTEVGLRSQINVYTDKYDEFQNALVKSNQMFGGFKGEMEKMSKKITSLEKESLTYKGRWQSAQAALLELCGERQTREARLQRLEGLCRTLQAERTSLLATLKDNNIERPPLPAMPPPPPAGDKVEAMAANCVQLKESLANLQNQLNVLTTKSETAKPEKSEKKKSKSKKNKQKKEDNEPKEEDKKETDSVVAATDPTQPINGDANDTEKSIETPVEDVKVDAEPEPIVDVKSEKNGVIDEHNSSFIESNPMEEISHIPEVKLIGQTKK